MIICFSGTGNSRKIADLLQEQLGDEIIRLAPGQMIDPTRVNLEIDDGRLIWVFPIHSWGLPKTVINVLRHANISREGNVKHFMVCTCGDDIGYADRQWRKELRMRGHRDCGVFSVQMPNTYTMMRGFDVDPLELANQKLEACEGRAIAIANAIEDEKEVNDVVRGSWAWVKTAILYPLFMVFMINPKKFHTTEACVGCGKCSRNCPLSNIVIIDGRPNWGKNCTMCSRCYHCCPQHAIQYGKATQGKGQYICPDFTLK